MLKDDLEKITEHLKSELAKLRAGRASIDLVENITVEAYNTKMPLNQLASLSSPEPRLIVVKPWDKSIIKDIENALRKAISGVNPVLDGDTIRIPYPAATEERRRELVKELHRIVEETKIKIRRVREEALEEGKIKEDKKEISEDELFRRRNEVQSAVDKYNKNAEDLGKKKEEEIMAI
ncbi:MAG: ribosome recycling factor [Candidatus Spechtbacterales bacterium]